MSCYIFLKRKSDVRSKVWINNCNQQTSLSLDMRYFISFTLKQEYFFFIKKYLVQLLSTTFWCHARGRLTPPGIRLKYPEWVKIMEKLVGYARNGSERLIWSIVSNQSAMVVTVYRSSHTRCFHYFWKSKSPSHNFSPAKNDKVNKLEKWQKLNAGLNPNHMHIFKPWKKRCAKLHKDKPEIV